MSDWRLDLRVGPIVTTERSGDEGDYGPADGLTVTSSWASDELPPAWVKETAEFELIAATAAELRDIRVGDPVSIAWRSPDTDDQPSHGVGYDSWALRFDGQVTDVELIPHRAGTLARINAVDYLTARLPEYAVTDASLPQQRAWDRLHALTAAAGVVEPVGFFADNGPLLRAVDISDANLLELLEQLAVQYVDPTALPPYALTRMSPDPHGCVYVPSPSSVGGHGAAGRDFDELSFAMRAPTEAPRMAPGVFGLTPGGYGVLIEGSGPNRGRLTIPSGVVEFSAAWTQRKGQGPNRVRVLYGTNPQKPNRVDVSNGDPGPRVVHTITTELVNQSDALELALLYLPPYDGDEPWAADKFTWLLEHDTPPTWRLPLPGDVVTIADIPPQWTPLDSTWHAGLCEAATFQLEGGSPTVTVTIRPEIPRFSSDDASFTLADLRADWPAVTIDQLNGDTLTDYRLLRGHYE